MPDHAPPNDAPLRVPVDPPVIFAGFLGGALLIQRWAPIQILPPQAGRPVGIGLLGSGLLILVWAVARFQRVGTSPKLTKPTRALVTNGPYRFSRNPIYVGYLLLYCGAAAWINTVWPLVVAPVLLVVITRTVIAREERYLEARFGDDYRGYRRQVRRWL